FHKAQVNQGGKQCCPAPASVLGEECNQYQSKNHPDNDHFLPGSNAPGRIRQKLAQGTVFPALNVSNFFLAQYRNILRQLHSQTNWLKLDFVGFETAQRLETDVDWFSDIVGIINDQCTGKLGTASNHACI